MLTINKITSDSTVDFAAEELKKYLRMMMPEAGDIKISYDPEAKEGFRLGLMQDFGLDVSDAEDPELDDILYINCNTGGGIIAGDNPRSVLLSVYEYLRQNGCRWLMPGVDGEFIPMQDIVPVTYRHKPSCRYRGWCNEGAEFQQNMLETIDFSPKVGLNVYMMEFRVPTSYYATYYNHTYNTENRPPEPISDNQVIQWKRQCEAEIAKRGLQFHDIGHGFTVDPFGIDSARCWEKIDSSDLSEENRGCLAMVNGKRGLWRDQPLSTSFCMSSTLARKKFVDYVADYAEKHSNVTYLHLWLADDYNNQCECEECVKRDPSDWYMILLNETDRELTRRGLGTRLVFIVYYDTIWPPITEKLDNPDRFTLLLAPISRDYSISLASDPKDAETRPFTRNKNILPKNLEEYFAYFDMWKKNWSGANLSYEYHFWRHQCFDLSGIRIAKRINEDVKVYKSFDVNGIVEDGSQRSFFPTGFAFYTCARTLFDNSLTTDEIAEDYFSCAFGEDWRLFYDFLEKLEKKIPFEYLGCRMKNGMYAPERREEILSVKEDIAEGRRLIESHYNSEYRIRTVSVRLLEIHARFVEMLAEALGEKCIGNNDAATELFRKTRVEIGKEEARIETFFDHGLWFGHLRNSSFARPATPPEKQ